MATTLYFRNSSATIDYRRGTNDANLRGTAVGWDVYVLSSSRGSSASYPSVTTIGSNTSGLEVGGEQLEWVSPPLDADVTIAGNDTYMATIGITLAATDVVSVRATLATVSFTLFGVEVT